MKTAFTIARVPLWSDLEFVIDGNSKITCEDGTPDQPVANAFSLPHISTCPGSTPTCRAGCYVHGLQEHAKDTYAHYVQNERTLHKILISDRTADRAADILGRYIAQHVTRFRWHVSGDVMSSRHAAWISAVCAAAPGVRFWIYTRTFGVLHALRARNLVVNLSADADNIDTARAFAQAGGLRLCYYTRAGEIPDLPPGSVVFPDYPLRGRDLADPLDTPFWVTLTREQKSMVCPADYFGQSDAHRCGPCRKCLV